ncbi:MAG TPA: aldehyde dehydrogenase (NADP(+)) [Cyclobacteriaceae bacterium]|mgnify:CR=1 FL=1|nr:aldehyde dehydrogenase (NADP(+)) [Cyclobacteriaceae bacterium]MCB9238763.1 aldehyde dehydrogenase (NADP(+)) [Flammeovirgaceae bacterium]MCB0498039.1 aldehyde dehydrogenase (NADP(+)) [Cyclobacteriaceae bacterium]MCO5270482.1 aldehyde dehydrogenase (NADP(+)) [Cyclobacteriaceae bacterium]MCW5901077.1 aldehyde dehydrogenase (NADP(+)) [Cyclobacteriaceae bacterium]
MSFKDATLAEVDAAMNEAHVAFLSYKNFDGKKRAAFLRAIADEIEALGDELVKTAMGETALPEARIIGERGRTTGHCRMFADYIEEGSWVEARIDTAMPDRTPAPKPDIRKKLVPLGPVVVFGAANFPLAYSTAGGDTASALAAGCPVIVKAHPAHAKTSELVAGAIKKAMGKTGMPAGVFQHLHGAGFEVGQALVKHPRASAVGFTGSYLGGKALFDMANQRPTPIPVFAEMSSTNPVILLPDSLARDYEQTAGMLASSMVLGVGQFCTNPGLIFAVEGDGLGQFIKHLSAAISKSLPAEMLHEGIARNYVKRLSETLSQKGVKLEVQAQAESKVGDKDQGRPTVASVQAPVFMENPSLAEEVFGPFSLIVRCKDMNELNTVMARVHGQLTSTLIGGEKEIAKHTNLINILMGKAGRLIINGVPTGVEVCPSQNHGGPFPSTTDSRFTAVGTDAIKRFARPVAFQNFPDSLLPDELKNANDKGIWRVVNGEMTRKGLG